MPEVVYTRARVRASRAYIYRPNNNNNNNLYMLTPTHYIYWALRGSALV